MQKVQKLTEQLEQPIERNRLYLSLIIYHLSLKEEVEAETLLERFMRYVV